MSKELQVFEYNGANVRTVEIDGEVWLVAKDVCEVLGIQNHKDAISSLDEDEKCGVAITDPIGREQVTSVINEPGLYKLTFKSRKPAAKDFTRWVTHEVLPTIRKTGSYSAPDTEPLNVRVRVAEVLQRLALQEPDKGKREVIMRTAYKYATGEDLPEPERKAKPEHTPRRWTATHIGGTLKWSADAVMHRAENLGIGHWDGETWSFDKDERLKFLELVGRGVERIADGYEYYDGGYKRIHWSFKA